MGIVFICHLQEYLPWKQTLTLTPLVLNDLSLVWSIPYGYQKGNLLQENMDSSQCVHPGLCRVAVTP